MAYNSDRAVVGPTDALSKELKSLSSAINIETVDCHVLDPSLCSVVIGALSDVESKWRPIGTFLHLKGKVLEKIDKNNRGNSSKCLEAVVQEWLNLNYNVVKFGKPTWQFVICAVSKGSGNNRLAIELAKKFRHPWDCSKYVPSVSSCLGDSLSIIDDKIDEDDLLSISGKLAEGLAGRWAHFGLQLGLTQQAIQDIHARLENTLTSVTLVLEAGCEGKTVSQNPITWRTLAVAVDAPSGGNNPLLAKEIADEHRDPAYIKKHPPILSRPTQVSSQDADNCDNSTPFNEEDLESILRDFKPENEVDGIVRDKLQAGVRFLARKLGMKVVTELEQQEKVPGGAAATPSQLPPTSNPVTSGSAPVMTAPAVKPTSNQKLKEFGHYPVNGTPDNPPTNRGCALIFSISKFQEHSLARSGANADTENLKKTFQHLGYEVKVYENEQCTARGVELMFDEIRQKYSAKSAALNPHDSFVCCFSSHGVLDKLTGEEYIVPYDYNIADAEPRIKLPQLCSMINAKNCPALATKPKLFFVQACRGKELPRVVRATVVKDKGKTALDAIESEEIHQDSDMLFSFSTRFSNKSARHTVDGSWYVQELSKLLQSDAAKRKDICTLMTELHRRVVANHKEHLVGTPFRQCPELTHTLRLAFYFYRQV